MVRKEEVVSEVDRIKVLEDSIKALTDSIQSIVEKQKPAIPVVYEYHTAYECLMLLLKSSEINKLAPKLPHIPAYKERNELLLMFVCHCIAHSMERNYTVWEAWGRLPALNNDFWIDLYSSKPNPQEVFLRLMGLNSNTASA